MQYKPTKQAQQEKENIVKNKENSRVLKKRKEK